MDTTRIIRGTINSMGCTVTSAITQWDYGWQFIPEIEDLPPTYRLDFSNEEKHGTALPVYCSTDGAEVPTELIDTGKDVWVWFVRIGDGFGKSEYKWRIPNKCKPKTEQDEPTPTQQSSIDQLIVRSNEAVTSAEQSASDASASAQSAQGYASQAETAKSDAQTYANNAQTSATQASTSASQASTSATASAQSASQSAQIKSDVESLVDDAQGYADSASQSATASATSASQAQGFAQSASASAQSASGYASSAQTSANTASAKAQDASQSATTASQKATEASQSASQALGYKNDAESAKTASQTAQGLAESARDDAEQIKTDVQNIAEGIDTRLVDVENDVIKAFPTDTASGAVASFSDGADNLPLKSLVVDINPIQDLSHGAPSPENICPISGWTQVDVEQSGVNVWDGEVGATNTYIDASTGIATGATSTPEYRSSDYFDCRKFQGKTLTLNHGARGKYPGIAFYDTNKNHISGLPNNSQTAGGSRTFSVPSNAYFLRFTTLVDYASLIQLELGSTATPYEPYSGQSINIALGQTVYGGKLDVLSGVLTVDRAMVDLGTLNWNTRPFGNNTTGFVVNGVPNGIATTGGDGKGEAICSCYKTVKNKEMSYPETDMALAYGAYYSQGANFYLRDSRFSNASDLQAWLSGQTIAYKLATPLTIQLDAHAINSLYGVNNIWADSGDTTAEYRADTKAWIQRKIAEAIASLT